MPLGSTALNVESVSSTPAQMAKTIASERWLWGKFIRDNAVIVD